MRKLLKIITIIGVVTLLFGGTLLPLSSAIHVTSTETLLPKYELTDPVRVRIKFYDIVTNNLHSTRTVKTTWACPTTRMNQKIEGNPVAIVYTGSYTFAYDNWGQEVAYWERQVDGGATSTAAWNLQVGAILKTITWHIDPNEIGTTIPRQVLPYLALEGSKYCFTSATVQGMASQAAGGATNMYDKAWNIYMWVINNLYYYGDGQWSDVLTVITQGHGTCSEYAWVYIALCRLNGIPARYVGGTAIRDTANLPYIDTVYHRWCEIYFPNYGWVPVDPSRGDTRNDPPGFFCRQVNDLFVTTVGGGDSTYLKWGYNLSTNCNPSWDHVDHETKAIWSEYTENKDIDES